MTDQAENIDTEDQEHEDHEPGAEVEHEDHEPTDEVAQLRQEAASRRVQAREAVARADALSAALTQRVVRSAVDGLLADPADFARFAQSGIPVDDDGLPDEAAIRTLAEGIVADHPHLAARRFGQVDAGPQGDAPPGPTSIMSAIRGLG